MDIKKSETLPLRSDDDIVLARRAVRQWAVELKFGLVDQTKIVTAASELARNTLLHGGGGIMRMDSLAEGSRVGLRLSFEDEGPGIPDIALALKDGYTSKDGMGLGLGGSKRLMGEFEIDTKVGVGTRITVAKWKLA